MAKSVAEVKAETKTESEVEMESSEIKKSEDVILKTGNHKEMYKSFVIHIKKFKGNQKGSEDDVKLFEANFTDRDPLSKGQQYSKVFTNKDLATIKKEIQFHGIENEKLKQIILYSLSEQNTKYGLQFDVISNNTEKYIKISIEYDTEFFSINFSVNIPAKLSDFDAMKQELKRTTTKLTQTSTLITSFKNEIRLLKQKSQTLELKNKEQLQEFSDFKEGYINQIRNELDTAMKKLKGGTVLPPILFRELYKETIKRSFGWNTILFNSFNKDDDIKYNNENGEIILKQGKYIIGACTYLDGGYNAQIQFLSKDDDNKKLCGTMSYGDYKIEWNNYSSSSSMILNQLLQVTDENEIFYCRVYNSNDAAGFCYFDDNCKDINGYCYSTALSIQKIL